MRIDVNSGVSSVNVSVCTATSPIQVVPGALLFLLMLSAPPSPRWLLKQGRDAAAVAVVARLRGSTGDNADVAVSVGLISRLHYR